ncbi:MAG TPA: TonB family protein [Terriglobia bacterium]|jgi:protein TonB|nr:TonB family protein [Terriglobia bacterium]
MSTETLSPALPFEGRESLRGSILISAGMHAVLLGIMLGYGLIRFGRGEAWGNPWEKGSSARVKAVSSLPGVPLPAPMQVTPNTLANDSPGLYKSEPIPPLPLENAEPIPKFKDEIKPVEPKRINTRIQKQELTPPPNAIPYGANGQPAMSYSQAQTAAGEAGISFGEGDFGSRYGWYVSAVRSRVSSNWLLSTISPTLTLAPRVFVEFTIQRDGTISGIRLAQSSGIPDVDRSALRAVEASSPLGALPSDFSGSSVSVSFYFDFHR